MIRFLSLKLDSFSCRFTETVPSFFVCRVMVMNRVRLIVHMILFVSFVGRDIPRYSKTMSLPCSGSPGGCPVAAREVETSEIF